MLNFVYGKFLVPSGIKTTLLWMKTVLSLGRVCTRYNPCLNMLEWLILKLFFLVIGAVAYWLFGFAFAFGAESNKFIGHKYFALADLPSSMYSFWFFHFVFAATAATIVSGAMAERTEFKAYLLYSVFLTGEFSKISKTSRLTTVTLT